MAAIRSTSSERRRRPYRLSGLGAIAATTLLLAHAAGQAAPSPVPVQIDYRAGAGCPPESGFVDQLTSRSRRIRPGTEPGTLLTLKLGKGRRGARGDLVIHYPDGSEARRDVDGETCDAVVSALALMTVLALDPGAVSNPVPSAEPPAASSSAPPAPQPSEDRASPETPIDLRTGWHVALGATAEGAGGMGPALIPDFAAFVEMTSAHASVWSPTLRGSFQYATGANQNVAGGQMSVSRAAFALDVCPLRWTPGPFRLLPCLLAEGGALTASGVDVQPERTDTRPWVTVGALGRIRYVPSGPFFVELDGGVRFPLVRDQFFFAFTPTDDIYRPPPLAGFVGGALGFTIL
jgi:hypothetical protein